MKDFFVFLDADGCVYNPNYKILLAEIIDRFKSDIQNLHAENFSDVTACRELAAKLLTFIESYQEADFQVYKQAHPHFEINKTFARQFTRFLDELNPLIMGRVVTRANTELLADILKAVQADREINRIIFLVASNRQSAGFDRHNQAVKATGSFFKDLPVIADACDRFLREKGYERRVLVDKFLTADIFSNQKAGTSYQLALTNPGDDDQAHACFDETKGSLVYALLHHIAIEYPATDTRLVYFYDDKMYILKAIDAAFGWNAATMLPSHTQFVLRQYVGKAVTETRMLFGDAPPDAHYYDSVRKMVILCGGNPEDIQGFKTDVCQMLNLPKFLVQREAHQIKLAAEAAHREAARTAHNHHTRGGVKVFDGTRGTMVVNKLADHRNHRLR